MFFFLGSLSHLADLHLRKISGFSFGERGQPFITTIIASVSFNFNFYFFSKYYHERFWNLL